MRKMLVLLLLACAWSIGCIPGTGMYNEHPLSVEYCGGDYWSFIMTRDRLQALADEIHVVVSPELVAQVSDNQKSTILVTLAYGTGDSRGYKPYIVMPVKTENERIEWDRFFHQETWPPNSQYKAPD